MADKKCRKCGHECSRTLCLAGSCSPCFNGFYTHDFPPIENAGPHPGSILLRAYSDFTRDPSDQHFAAMMFAAVEYRNYKRNKQAKAVAEHTVGPVTPEKEKS